MFAACSETWDLPAAPNLVTVRRNGARAVLEVADDGRGVDAQEATRAREQGHVGLSILEELVRDAGGTLDLRGRDGGGTVMRVEVPAP